MQWRANLENASDVKLRPNNGLIKRDCRERYLLAVSGNEPGA